MTALYVLIIPAAAVVGRLIGDRLTEWLCRRYPRWFR